MNGIVALGDLSTRKVINRLCHGLESCIMYLVNQSDSVPDRAGEYKHQITLTSQLAYSVVCNFVLYYNR